MQLQKKAQEIWSSPPNRRPCESKKKDNNIHISIPNLEGVDTVARYLESTGIKVAITTGRKSGELLRKKNKDKTGDMVMNSVVYQIPCGVCHRKYVGETGRELKTRLVEHKRDVCTRT